MTETSLTIGDDLIVGAVNIGRFLFANSEAAQGLTDEQLARKVFHLVNTSRLPVFRLGSRICARRTVLLAWVARQESRNSGQHEKSSETLKLVAGQNS